MNAPSIPADLRARLVAYHAEPVVSFVEAAGCTVRLLKPGERFDSASKALSRLRVACDDWPIPPAGLFVVEERAIYLRSCTDMTLLHEFGHALDCALGGGVYASSTSRVWRSAFAEATRFVTPYAGRAVDEYFAECVRAYVEANDPTCPWPVATRGRLRSLDPTAFDLVERDLRRAGRAR